MELKDKLHRKRWDEKNKIKVRAYKINYRAKQMGRPGLLVADELVALFETQTACRDCASVENLTVGHGIPLVYPCSSNEITNCFIQCKSCNWSQGWQVHPDFITDELSKYLPVWQK